MIVGAYTKDFRLIAYDIPYSSLVWQRRWFDFGEFQMQVPASVYDGSWELVMSPDMDDIGLVQRVEYSSDDGGSIIVSGLFYESVLDWGSVRKRYTKGGNVDELCADIIETFYLQTIDGMRDTYLVDVKNRKNAGIGSKYARYNADFVGDAVGTKVNSMLESRGLSQQVTYDGSVPKWDVREGRDLTSQFTLSSAYGDLADVSVVLDDSAYRNVAVLTWDDGYGRLVDPLPVKDVKGDEELRELFDELSEAPAATDNIVTIGRELLTDYERVMDIDAVVTNYDAVGTLYDLGDILHIVIDEIGLELDTRIVEITETFGRDGRNVHVGFGNKRITNMRRMMATWR